MERYLEPEEDTNLEDAGFVSSQRGSYQNSCDHCGGHVSDDFKRVFGVEEDGEEELYACPECSANAGIQEQSLERMRD